MEILTLTLFCLGLLLCIVMNWSILYALGAGLIFFLIYGKFKGFSWKELAKMSFSGIISAKNVIINFLLIGMLTALWRAAGTIPFIVCSSVQLISPSLFLVMVFLLNCLVSVLTGTSFGTSATMGVICAAIGSAMNVPILFTGGAVLSGALFGDRCSPVSTSALLVADMTQTSIFNNIKRMVKTALVPFIITCIIYTLMGFFSHYRGNIPNLNGIFSGEFTLYWTAIIPALVILILAAKKVNVKIAMSASILSAIPVCVFLQHIPWENLPGIIINGFEASDPKVASLLNGGGIVSMLKVTAIIIISSSYTGIFQKTGLLNSVKDIIERTSRRTTSYTATLITSILASLIACNQTLAIMLTEQLCEDIETDKGKAAINLEDTAVVVSPLVPWSIAGAVPLASVGAPSASILLAFYLYLLPLWRLISETFLKHRLSKNSDAFTKKQKIL